MTCGGGVGAELSYRRKPESVSMRRSFIDFPPAFPYFPRLNLSRPDTEPPPYTWFFGPGGRMVNVRQRYSPSDAFSVGRLDCSDFDLFQGRTISSFARPRSFAPAGVAGAEQRYSPSDAFWVGLTF